jgi:hypothetical protein
MPTFPISSACCFEREFACYFSLSACFQIVVLQGKPCAPPALEGQADTPHSFVINKLIDLPALEACLRQ